MASADDFKARFTEARAQLAKFRQHIDTLRELYWKQYPAETPLEQALRGVTKALSAARGVWIDPVEVGEDQAAEFANMLHVADMIIENLSSRVAAKRLSLPVLPTVADTHDKLRRVVSAVHGIRNEGDARLLALRTINLAAHDSAETWEATASWLCNVLGTCTGSLLTDDEHDARKAAIVNIIGVWKAVTNGSNTSKWEPTNKLLSSFGLAANSAAALEHAWKTPTKPPGR